MLKAQAWLSRWHMVRWHESVEASSSRQVVCFDPNTPRDVSHSLMHLPARSLACAGR